MIQVEMAISEKLAEEEMMDHLVTEVIREKSVYWDHEVTLDIPVKLARQVLLELMAKMALLGKTELMDL